MNIGLFFKYLNLWCLLVIIATMYVMSIYYQFMSLSPISLVP